VDLNQLAARRSAGNHRFVRQAGFVPAVPTLGLAMHPRYPDWLRYVFDRNPEGEGWYFDIEIEPFHADEIELARLIELTCLYSGADLLAFSDMQVNRGLDFIFNPSCSDTVFALGRSNVPIDLRIRAIRSIQHLYSDCFAKRCTEVFSNKNELPISDLNEACYMLWDVAPIGRWTDEQDNPACLDASIEVLKTALTLCNTACIESALHGLGHLYHYAPERVESIVDNWLKTQPRVPDQLTRYAAEARVGYVQ
jgi:hypothetical protein